MAKVKSPSARKTTFPMTKAEFAEKAEALLPVNIGGSPLEAERKEFSTGSVGYYANGKIKREIDGRVVTFQVGLNITAVGSKDAS